MTLSRLLLALAATLAALLAPAGAALADPADISAASRSVVRVVLIESDGTDARLIGHGSGFVVAPGVVLTNAHVVEDARGNSALLIGIVPSQGRGGYAAQIAAFSPGNDLALLRFDARAPVPQVTLFPGQATDGEEVFAVGYPGNVDLAQGLSMSDLVTPQEAVKTRGYVSGGRSSKSFDTILHTAPIGAGNSGGPLLDACGRVIGVNTFGTVSDNGTDSAFYFAVSMREIEGFLKQAGIAPHTSGLPCTSIADLDRAESERAAGEQARQAAEAQARAEAKNRAADQARHRAELEILSERDNGMAIAALLLVAALAAGGGAFFYLQRKEVQRTRIVGGVAVGLLLCAILAWALRPPLSLIDERAKDILAEPSAVASATGPADGAGAGRLVCVFDASRSRVTVSDVTDVPLEWRADGCVNGRTQYGLSADGWSRVLVPNADDTVSVTHYDPQSRIYTVERFLMGLDAMTAARAARGKLTPPQCGAGDAAARAFGAAQQGIKALLPPEPNERIRYNCQPAG